MSIKKPVRTASFLLTKPVRPWSLSAFWLSCNFGLGDMQPRIIISALKGGSGKTIVSLGLASVWKEEGRRVTPFKKGPDFIDSGWLHFAADNKCYNLDPFLMTQEQIIQSFVSRSAGADISIIEGNRGLFDGLDIDGCCSTAELARLLETPVLIILDVSMTTRTIAAVVKGCQSIRSRVVYRGSDPEQGGGFTPG